MAFCRNCGEEIKDFENFCPKCGNSINKFNNQYVDNKKKKEVPTSCKVTKIIFLANLILLGIGFFVLIFSLFIPFKSKFGSIDGSIVFPTLKINASDVEYNLDIVNVDLDNKNIDYSVTSNFNYDSEEGTLEFYYKGNVEIKIDGIDSSNDYTMDSAEVHYIYVLPSGNHNVEFSFICKTNVTVYKKYFAVYCNTIHIGSCDIKVNIDDDYVIKRNSNSKPGYYLTESKTPKSVTYSNSLENVGLGLFIVAFICLIPTTTLFVVFKITNRRR